MTAIQWLKDQYMKADEPAEVLKILLAFEEAIKLEKQQMEDAFNEGYNIRRAYRESDNYVTSTEYYNSIYGSNSEKPNLSEIPTSSQTTSDKWKEYQDWLNEVPKISDEEIEKEAEKRSKSFNGFTTYEKSAWVSACKWYREQIKKK